HHDDLVIRRVATEILGQVHVPDAAEVLVNALSDPDAVVRKNALKALASRAGPSWLPEVERMLGDPDADVRMEAIACLRRLDLPIPDLRRILEPLLADPLPAVRIRAAAALLGTGQHEEARVLLRRMVTSGDMDARLEALEVIPVDFDLVAAQLSSSWSLVRRAAARALARLDPERALPILMDLLHDRDVRETAARELGRLGGTVVEPLLKALSEPELEEGALLGLSGLPIQDPGPVELFARRRAAQALHYDALLRGLPPDGERMGLLVALLGETAHRHGIAALRAVSLLGDTDAISLAIENLDERSAASRASVLEALESISEPGRGIIRPLIALWEDGSQPATLSSSANPLETLLLDPDPWARACAAFAAHGQPALQPVLKELSCTDPVPLVREAALVSTGEPVMDSLPTLSLMERILFLRRVPLFEKLSTTDLKMVAALADEVVFGDGEEIARQDEPGDTMYIIVSGEVVVKAAKSDGGQRELARRGPGAFVGEMSIISQEPRMASLVADGDVRTLCIDHRGFQGLLRERPELSLAVMHELSTRIREMARKAA
ncbi:MAG: HEAT repeat domain-containing protein, partial [Bacteroidota bacterium]